MCGGVVYNLERVPEEDLHNFYSDEQILFFKKKGMISSFFWDKRPILPVEKENKIHLVDWGNRNKKAPFPQTGWARKETIKTGRWKWLNPREVKIPVEKGYEKKVWFDFKNGTDGLLVEKDGDKRVYIITENSDKKYLKETGHDRMPPGQKSNFNKEKKTN